MNENGPVLQKIKEKQNEINEEKKLKKKKVSINRLVLGLSLILLLVTLISLSRIVISVLN